MAEPNPEALMELAEMLLDDEGQVEVSVLIDEGELRKAQMKLLGAADALMQRERLSREGLAEIMSKLGLSTRDIERIRGDNAGKFAN